MNKWEKEYIQRKLPELIENTLCRNTGILSRLCSAGVLHIWDVDNVDSAPTDIAQAKMLYKILFTRTNGYDTLMSALSETNQTGAYEILKSGVLKNEPVRLTKGLPSEIIKFGAVSSIGQGRNATLVHDGTFGRRSVAVKKIVRELTPLSTAINEIDLLAQLDSHDNIVRYFKTELQSNSILIAMERCTENLLNWILQKREGISPTEILQQLTDGVAYIHDNNIVHGDLKPDNVLMQIVPQTGFRVKVADFGSSIKLDGRNDEGNTTLTYGVASKEWMAPEVHCYTEHECYPVLNKMTYKSDIFSLGCIYYFVLTGGDHLFGNKYQRHANIIDNVCKLDLLKLRSRRIGDAFIINNMVSHCPASRPAAASLVQMPLFWSNAKVLKFLRKISEAINNKKEIHTNDVDVLEGQFSNIVLNANGLDNNWTSYLCPVVYRRLNSLHLSKNKSVLSLVNFIEYTILHYQSLPKDFKNAIGDFPDGFVSYWFHQRFPLLIPLLWIVFEVRSLECELKNFYGGDFQVSLVLLLEGICQMKKLIVKRWPFLH